MQRALKRIASLGIVFVLVADVAGRRLYAINPASNDISVMRVNPDGSLDLLGAPVASRGVMPAGSAPAGLVVMNL